MTAFIMKMFNKGDSINNQFIDENSTNRIENFEDAKSTMINPTNEFNEDVLDEYDMVNPITDMDKESKSEEDTGDKVIDINALPEFKKVQDKYLEEQKIAAMDNIKEFISDNLEKDPLSIKNILLKEFSNIDKNYVEAQENQKNYSEAKQVTVNTLKNYEKQYENLNRNLTESIKIEKYTEADNIQQDIISIAGGIKKTKEQLCNLSQLIDKQEHEKISLKKQKVDLLKFVIEKTNHWIRQEESSIMKYEASMNNQIEAENMNIEAEQDNIKKLENKMNDNKEEHNQKLKSFEESLSSVCKDLYERENTLNSEINVIDEKIKELENKLMVERAEREKKHKERNKIQNEIELKKQGCEPQRNEILSIEKVIRETETAIGMSISRTNMMKNTVQSKERIKTDLVTSRKQIVAKVDAVIKEFTKENDSLQSKIFQMENLSKNLEELQAKLIDIKTNKNGLEDKKQINNDKILKDDLSITDGINLLNNLKVRIEKLDEEKKVLANARKFKEAGNASNEIKNIQTQIETLEKAVEEAKKEKQHLTKEINEIAEEYLKYKKNEEICEKELITIKYKRIKLNIEELEVFITNVKISEDDMKILKSQIETYNIEKKSLEDSLASFLAKDNPITSELNGIKNEQEEDTEDKDVNETKS